MQDRAIQEELDTMAHSPDRTRRYVEYKKAETAFRLWDLDANGKVLREKITRGLLKYASAQCHKLQTFQSQGLLLHWLSYVRLRPKGMCKHCQSTFVAPALMCLCTSLGLAGKFSVFSVI